MNSMFRSTSNIPQVIKGIIQTFRGIWSTDLVPGGGHDAEDEQCDSIHGGVSLPSNTFIIISVHGGEYERPKQHQKHVHSEIW